MPNPMTPQVRALYRKALQNLADAGLPAKPQFHLTEDARSLLTEGPRLPNAGTNESWKPRALYTSDNLPDNLASVLGDQGSLSEIKDLVRDADYGGREYVRVVPKPGFTQTEIPEAQLQETWRNTPMPSTIEDLNKLDATQFPGIDMIKLTDVDNYPGLNENLIRNPKAFSIFGKDKVWNPLLAGTVGAAALATPEESEAGKIPKLPSGAIDFVAAKKTKELNNFHQGFMDDIRTKAQELAQKVLDYPDWGYQVGERFRSAKTGKTYEVTGRHWNSQKDTPMYMTKTIGEDETGSMYAKSGSNEKSSWKGVEEIMTKLTGPKKLGVAGLVAGMLPLLGSNDAEAMPFGPATKQTVRSAAELGLKSVPHDDAYKIIGRTFNFPAINGPGTIENLTHNAKTKTYTLIVTDAQNIRHEIPMTKDYFKLLMQSTGAEEYIGNFKEASRVGQEIQASKGLTIREAKRDATSDITHTQLRGLENSSVQKIKEMSPDLAQSYVFFKSAQDLAPVYIPKAYAQRLMKMGIGRITEEGPK